MCKCVYHSFIHCVPFWIMKKITDVQILKFTVTTTVIKSWTQALNSQRKKRCFQSRIKICMPLELITSSELQSLFPVHVPQYCKVPILHAESSAYSGSSSLCRGLAIKQKLFFILCLMKKTNKIYFIKNILFMKPSSIIEHEHF